MSLHLTPDSITVSARVSLTHGEPHPFAPVNLALEQPTALDIIGAGIGSWIIQSAAATHGHTLPRKWLARLLLEAATGFICLPDGFRITMLHASMQPIYERWYALDCDIQAILNDLPARLWQRVMDELTDCEPVRALTIIQIHTNVVRTLTSPDASADATGFSQPVTVAAVAD